MARIVLIDDEARLLATLARFLELQGHEVMRGASFAAVEQHLRPGRFEVLVTDIVMPDFDGMQVLREVVEVRGCLEPVVLITGEPNLETAAEAVRRGAFDYVQKPVTKDRLLEVVTRGLRHVKLLRERDQAREMELQLLRNLATLGESASVLSHEIRTPITSLRHALRAVGQKLGIEDKVLVEEFATNLGKIERLLGETLSFARPLRPDRKLVPLSALVESALQEVRASDAFAEMAVQRRGLEPILVDVDPQLFGQILSNLLRNAAEACGGKGRIEVEAKVGPAGLLLDVVDDGPGVPADKRSEIFKPFSSSKTYGTGIGLAFSRKVIESHGGTIELMPAGTGLDDGDGARFRITLPALAVADRDRHGAGKGQGDGAEQARPTE